MKTTNNSEKLCLNLMALSYLNHMLWTKQPYQPTWNCIILNLNIHDLYLSLFSVDFYVVFCAEQEYGQFIPTEQQIVFEI